MGRGRQGGQHQAADQEHGSARLRGDPGRRPNDVEKGHHYLWRFWSKLPKAGHITVFDRSWYGRVLVERVEGFCSAEEWKRAYREINEMEEHLVSFGTVLVKFWLQIDEEEQLKRFKEREETAWKQWKITPDDWRNREKWCLYQPAVEEMLARTSTSYAPWTIVESDSQALRPHQNASDGDQEDRGEG